MTTGTAPLTARTSRVRNVTCVTCGALFIFVIRQHGGRAPLRCEKCRARVPKMPALLKLTPVLCRLRADEAHGLRFLATTSGRMQSDLLREAVGDLITKYGRNTLVTCGVCGKPALCEYSTEIGTTHWDHEGRWPYSRSCIRNPPAPSTDPIAKPAAAARSKEESHG